MVDRNPFKPTAGASPPLLVGRSEELDEFAESLDDGPGAPSRLVRFTGARGVGKTVMLNEVARLAHDRGWVTIEETATAGLATRMTAAISRHLREGGGTRRRVTGVSLPSVMGIGGGGLELSSQADPDPELRAELGRLLAMTEARGAGVLITVDEVHAAAREDLRTVAAVFQHLVREDREVALALAGLGSAVSDLLNDDVLTFLRRATPVELTDVPLPEVRAALLETITSSGRRIDDDALDAATAATGGYPFMIQLVGYHVWRKATGGTIDAAAAALGIPAARKRLGATVHATALADLSDVDRTYLVAMAQDDGPARTGDVAARLGETPQYANVYRNRLLDAGVIVVVRHGSVDFALPYLREYLRDHAARFEMAGRAPSGRRRRRQDGGPA